MRNKSYDEAISRLTAAIAQDPQQPSAHFQRARAYAAKSDWDKAIADSKAAGSNGIAAFLSLAAEIQDGTSAIPLKAGQRIVVTAIEGDSLRIQPIFFPKREGLVKKSSVLPILP